MSRINLKPQILYFLRFRRFDAFSFILLVAVTFVATIIVWLTIYNSKVADSKESGTNGISGLRTFDFCTLRAQTDQNIRCLWPPKSPEELISPDTRRYDLTLRPRVLEDEESLKLGERYYWWANILYNGTPILGSWLKRLVVMDRLTRMSQPFDNYYLYPQIMDVEEAVHSVRQGMAVKQAPINDPYLEVFHKPKNVCFRTNENDTQELVVLIKSCAGCFLDRKHVRETYMQKYLWGDFRIQFAFVTGLPAEKSKEPILIENVLENNRQGWPNGNLDATSLKALLFEEAVLFDDIVVGNFLDTYFNLTLKQMFTFRWVSVFCKYQSPVYLFIDNDYSIVPANLIKLVRSIPNTFKPRMNAGIRGPDRIVRRPKLKDGVERGGVSEDEIPWNIYPEYSSGACYFIGADLLIDVTVATAFTKRFRFEDAYLSFVWTKLKQRVYAFKALRHYIGPNQDISDLAIGPQVAVDKQMNWKSGFLNLTVTSKAKV
ncbi:hypothetical protein T265_14897 [Opisthorchis viverrini]|uniref:Hexosyltransferase n=1 Tax=Opisthorchis viverrini TaxID=6198 RepID=A0A074ZG87_OPIVI|nr:hypothetical protein T265_14897 [Opisthorchis viverrini]KER22270.1 hypothetical protein T265_14897 [Opisthorchis viverrini]